MPSMKKAMTQGVIQPPMTKTTDGNRYRSGLEREVARQLRLADRRFGYESEIIPVSQNPPSLPVITPTLS